MAQITRLELKGWKSIKAAELDFGPVNVLIGANGSGKSNLVSFFGLLRDFFQGQLRKLVSKEGGADSLLHFGAKHTSAIVAEIVFSHLHQKYIYGLELESSSDDTLIVSGESISDSNKGSMKLHSTHDNITESAFNAQFGEVNVKNDLKGELASALRNGLEKLFLAFTNAINGIQIFHFHDTSSDAKIRKSILISDNQQFYPDGANLAAMLYLYHQKYPIIYRRIKDTIGIVVPGFDDFVLSPDRLNSGTIRLHWRQMHHDYLLGPHQISDGSLRAMALIALLLQPEEDLPDVMILDEPELGLHPYAIEVIAGLIRAISLRTQVIVATQSPGLVNHFEPSEIIACDTEQGASVFRRLDAENLKDWLEDYSMGELWEKNVIGGGPLA